ncbi:MAG TPA: hypothetical protein VHQ01_04920 [Pyrinomonadaceae bacterium]|nr:hypothetical protein [Pyrinomonadaceae bacterium]
MQQEVLVSQESYFALINWLMLINTLPVIGFMILCIVWTRIARTPSKQALLGGMAGMLLVSIVLRIIVSMLPPNLLLILLIGILHGIMLYVMLLVFFMVTVIVKKRAKEQDLQEECRAAACGTSAAQTWKEVEVKMLTFGESLDNTVLQYGKKEGWL